MKLSMLTILFIFALPINAHDYHSSYRENNKCYGKIYREKYIPGSIVNPGYIRKWQETIRIPCTQHKIITSKVEFESNDYRKTIKDKFNSLYTWINSRLADWKSRESKNY
tara:strand:- start:126 stop:455 length:330 start_codon:yes stop_codon:yes gene_type:complete